MQSESSMQTVKGAAFGLEINPLSLTCWFARAKTVGIALRLSIDKTTKQDERIFIFVEYLIVADLLKLKHTVLSSPN